MILLMNGWVKDVFTEVSEESADVTDCFPVISHNN